MNKKLLLTLIIILGALHTHAQAATESCTSVEDRVIAHRAIYNDAGQGLSMRIRAIQAVGVVLKGNPDLAVAVDVVAELKAIYNDAGQDLFMRSSAILAVGLILKANPDKAVVAEVVDKLREFYNDPGQNISMRKIAILTAGLILKANPDKAVVAEVVDKLREFYNDPVEDLWIRSNAISAVGMILKANPDPAVAKDMVAELKAIYNDAGQDENTRSNAILAVGIIILNHPELAFGSEPPVDVNQIIAKIPCHKPIHAELIAKRDTVAMRIKLLGIYNKAWEEHAGKPPKDPSTQDVAQDAETKRAADLARMLSLRRISRVRDGGDTPKEAVEPFGKAIIAYVGKSHE